VLRARKCSAPCGKPARPHLAIPALRDNLGAWSCCRGADHGGSAARAVRRLCRKVTIEAYLLTEARRNGFPATVLHPGHLVGSGWQPINRLGNFNLQVFSDLARGKPVTLPNLGRECLYHVHADDVAQAFVRALPTGRIQWAKAFMLSRLRTYVVRLRQTIAGWFGQKAHLKFLP